MEGTRPVLVEIQALIAPTAFAAPRRAVVGWDGARLAMILAVLETRCGMAFGTCDVFLNVAGGLRIAEPADLAVAAALASAALTRPLPAETVVFGEIGLSGEVRAVARADARLKEAAKLGFATGIVPPRRGPRGRGGRGDRGRPRRRSAKTAATAERHRERAEIRECLTFRSPSPTSLSWACC